MERMPDISSPTRPCPRIRVRPGGRVRFSLTSRPTTMMKKSPPLNARRFGLQIVLSSGSTVTFTMDPMTTRLRHLAAFIAVQEHVDEEMLLLKVENSNDNAKSRRAKFKRVSAGAAARNLMKCNISPETRIVVRIDVAKAMGNLSI